MHHEMSRVQRFLNQNKQLYKIAQTVEQFTDKFLEEFGIRSDDYVTLKRGKGCFNCMNTGYRGRTGIFEILTVGEMIQEMIIQRRSAQEITRQAWNSGKLRTLREDAVRKVAQGVTTLEEAASAVMV